MLSSLMKDTLLPITMHAPCMRLLSVPEKKKFVKISPYLQKPTEEDGCIAEESSKVMQEKFEYAV